MDIQYTKEKLAEMAKKAKSHVEYYSNQYEKTNNAVSNYSIGDILEDRDRFVKLYDAIDQTSDKLMKLYDTYDEAADGADEDAKSEERQLRGELRSLYSLQKKFSVLYWITSNVNSGIEKALDRFGDNEDN